VNHLITGKYVELKSHACLDELVPPLACFRFIFTYLLASVRTVTAWPQKMFSQLQMPLSLLSPDKPVPPPVMRFKLMSKDIHALSSTLAGGLCVGLSGR